MATKQQQEKRINIEVCVCVSVLNVWENAVKLLILSKTNSTEIGKNKKDQQNKSKWKEK